MCGDSTQPLIVCGDAGCGKTAILAQAYSQVCIQSVFLITISRLEHRFHLLCASRCVALRYVAIAIAKYRNTIYYLYRPLNVNVETTYCVALANAIVRNAQLGEVETTHYCY